MSYFSSLWLFLSNISRMKKQLCITLDRELIQRLDQVRGPGSSRSGYIAYLLEGCLEKKK
jgi:metal-responsive CopG/Arc/MetJ family transcriptional regulator